MEVFYIKQELPINSQIRAKEVQLIDENGQKAGIISLEEAVETLTPLERKAAKRKCQEWLKERQKNLER